MMRKTWLSDLSRREFLQRGAVGAAGLAVGAAASPLLAQDAAGLASEYVSTFSFSLEAPQVIGAVADGFRQIYYVKDGTASGSKINGTFLPGGGDWVRVRPDGVFVLDIRVTLELDDGQLALATESGYGLITQEVLGRLSEGEDVDPSEYWMRIAIRFETASEQYAWLNQAIFIGVGALGPRLETVSYEIYQIL
jgi:hypothetical protein